MLYRPWLASGRCLNARREWQDASRALAASAGDRVRYARLLEQVGAVTAELRKRVGQTFTLDELAREYAHAERWSRDAVEDIGPPPDWPRTLSMVEGAAFHNYSRGAVDYAP
jgi:hypothetical protein